MLEIDEKRVHKGKTGLDVFPSGLQRRFDGRIDLPLLEGLKQLEQQLRLSEWLSPGDRHAASAVPVKGQILLDLTQDVGKTLVLTDYPQGIGRAYVPINLRIIYFVPGDVDFSIVYADLFACSHARAFETADTFAGIEEQLALIGLALGILAPDTMQGTAFEKNNGANSGTVMGRKSLNIENHILLSQVI